MCKWYGVLRCERVKVHTVVSLRLHLFGARSHTHTSRSPSTSANNSPRATTCSSAAINFPFANFQRALIHCPLARDARNLCDCVPFARSPEGRTCTQRIRLRVGNILIRMQMGLGQQGRARARPQRRLANCVADRKGFAFVPFGSVRFGSLVRWRPQTNRVARIIIIITTRTQSWNTAIDFRLLPCDKQAHEQRWKNFNCHSRCAHCPRDSLPPSLAWLFIAHHQVLIFIYC